MGPFGSQAGSRDPPPSPHCASPHPDLPEGETSHLQVFVNRGWAARRVCTGGPCSFPPPEFQPLVSSTWEGRKPLDTYTSPQHQGPRGFQRVDEGVATRNGADWLSLAGASPAEDLFPGRRYDGGLDSGFHSVDSGSKRWSGNEVRASFPRDTGDLGPRENLS